MVWAYKTGLEGARALLTEMRRTFSATPAESQQGKTKPSSGPDPVFLPEVLRGKRESATIPPVSSAGEGKSFGIFAMSLKEVQDYLPAFLDAGAIPGPAHMTLVNRGGFLFGEKNPRLVMDFYPDPGDRRGVAAYKALLDQRNEDSSHLPPRNETGCRGTFSLKYGTPETGKGYHLLGSVRERAGQTVVTFHPPARATGSSSLDSIEQEVRIALRVMGSVPLTARNLVSSSGVEVMIELRPAPRLDIG